MNTQITLIAAKSQHYATEYCYVGIRIQYDTYGAAVGDTLNHCSREWIGGDMTDTELSGVCCVDINAILDARQSRYLYDYGGNVILVLAADRSDSGEDEGELILRNPIILDIIELED